MPPDSIASPNPVVSSPAPLLERTLGPDWRCLTEAELRVGGESGPIDLVALHPRHGVVLAALLHKGEDASPAEAVAAFEAMLREQDFAGRFPGTLKVAAIAHEMGRRDRLAEAIREAAAEAPESPPEGAWVGWLAEKLAVPARTELRLVVPSPAEEPPAPSERLEAPSGRLIASEPAAPASRSGTWIAIAVLALALAGAALMMIRAGLGEGVLGRF